jgi:polyhydroxyalkanoate synthase subunit PhaC
MSHWADEARRQVGQGLDALGFGPQETPHRVIAEFPGARLRSYGSGVSGRGPVLLVVAAPFKRCYIWDLLPNVSAIRRCVDTGIRVYLLEWTMPTEREDDYGLAAYADALPRAAVDAIEAETGVTAPILAGHSIGGTFAAIFATLHPDRVRGLVLVDAPLTFGENGGPLARAAKVAPPAWLIRQAAGSPIAGSVINALSVAAAPDAFQFQRAADLAASALDPDALAIHARVERWTYDEFPLPGALFEEVLEGLYREDRFVGGTLQVGETRTGIARLRSPVVAVTNPAGSIVPPRSILDGLEAVPGLTFEVLEYEGERGPMLQHVGPLVGRLAHKRIWPRIVEWIGQVGRNDPAP